MYNELTEDEKNLLRDSRLKSFRFYYLKSMYDIYTLLEASNIEKAKENLKDEMRHMKGMHTDELFMLLDGITAHYLTGKIKKPE